MRMLQKWHHLLLRQKYVRSQRSLRFPHLKLKIPSPEGLGKAGERGWIAKGTRVDSDRGWHQAPPTASLCRLRRRQVQQRQKSVLGN